MWEPVPPFSQAGMQMIPQGQGEGQGEGKEAMQRYCGSGEEEERHDGAGTGAAHVCLDCQERGGVCACACEESWWPHACCEALPLCVRGEGRMRMQGRCEAQEG